MNTDGDKGTEAELKRLWQRYLADRRVADRNELVERHLHLVERMVLRIIQRLPRSVQAEDLNANGAIGLQQAVESFDPARGVTFATFCQRRVFGAIHDGLRNADHISRGVRRKQARVQRTRRDLWARLDREPSDAEMARAMKMPLREFEQLQKASFVPRNVSTENAVHNNWGNREVFGRDMLADPRLPRATAGLELRELLDDLLAGLTRTERLIIVLYHLENFTMKEIGRACGLSESRISQMHTNLLQRLRAQHQELIESN